MGLNLLVAATLIGNLTLTAYRPIKEQTDDSPTWTSIGDRTTMFGCAVSQDLLFRKVVEYGDILYIEGVGFRVVNDTMHPMHTMHVDVLVLTKVEEKRIGCRTTKVWVIKAKEEKINAFNWNKRKTGLGEIPVSHHTKR